MNKILFSAPIILVACASTTSKPPSFISDCYKISASVERSELIRQCFDLNGENIARLYQIELQKNPNINGTIEFNFEVMPGGRVSSVEVAKSNINWPSLVENYRTYIRLMRFPQQAVGNFTHKINLLNDEDPSSKGPPIQPADSPATPSSPHKK